MTSDIDSSGVLTREEREEHIIDLYFNHNKKYSEIARIARISPRDIKPVIDKAYQEKERQAHKSLAVQAYELFSKGKTLLQVTIDLNLRQAQATAYYEEYLKLVGLGDITKIYVQFKHEEYVEVIKSIENKISDFLSNKKMFLNIAITSVIESMRNDPEKYSTLVYHNNYNQNSLSSISKDNDNSNLPDASRQVILPPPPYDEYIIDGCKAIMLEEAEKLYNVLADQLVCEVINETISKQSTEALPALPLEANEVIPKDK
jgi:hypothetical protein